MSAAELPERLRAELLLLAASEADTDGPDLEALLDVELPLVELEAVCSGCHQHIIATAGTVLVETDGVTFHAACWDEVLVEDELVPAEAGQ